VKEFRSARYIFIALQAGIQVIKRNKTAFWTTHEIFPLLFSVPERVLIALPEDST
jgi:hypothetical protein